MKRCRHEQVSVVEYATTPLFFDVRRSVDGAYDRYDDGAGEPSPSGQGRIECAECKKSYPFPRGVLPPRSWPAWVRDAYQSTPPGGEDWEAP